LFAELDAAARNARQRSDTICGQPATGSIKGRPLDERTTEGEL
jgi:hypothetical protein